MKIILLFIIFISLLNATVKPLEKVSLQLPWKEQFQFAGYYMAKEKGFYKENGLSIEIREGKDSIDVSREVLSNKANFGIGRSSLIKLASDVKDIVLISAIFQSSPEVLLTLESSKIKKIEDFASKRVMLPKDSIQTASITAMMLSQGVQKKELNIQKQSYSIDALIDGKTDVYYSYISNEPYILEQKGIKYNSFCPKDYGFDFYSDILFTSKLEIDNNPQRVTRFKRASLKGWEYAFEHIEESARVIYEKYNSQNKTLDALIFEARELKKLAFKDGIALGDISKEKIRNIFEVYKIMGEVKNILDIDKHIFSKYSTLFTLEQNNYLRAKKKINVCVPPSAISFSGNDDKDYYVELSMDFLNIVSKKTFIDFNILKKPKKGQCDLIPLAFKTGKKAKSFKFTTPFYTEKLVIVTKTSQNHIFNINSAKDKTFSVVHNASYTELLKNKYPKLKIKYVKNTETGFRGVLEGKYYGHIDMKIVSAYDLQRNRELDLKISGQLDDEIDISFGINKDDKILLEIFERISLSVVDKDLQVVLNKWVPITYVRTSENKNLKIFFGFILFFMLAGLFVTTYKQKVLNRKNKELEDLKNELVILNKSLESKVEEAVAEVVKKDAFLLQQSRLALMGEMLSMIAHQWKQPLSTISTIQIAIKLALELETYDLKEEESRQEFIKFLGKKLEKLEKYTKNLSSIIEDFSDFYKPNKDSTIMQIDTILLKACDFSQDILKTLAIHFHIGFHSRRLVKVHENEILQTILNIINNAKDQLIEKKIENPSIKVKSYDKYGYAIVEISDNAGGIDKEIIEKIFNPYFSTKLDKNGTGLGLYMSKNIIEGYHRGSISVSNCTNADGELGAMFTIRIKQEDINVKI